MDTKSSELMIGIDAGTSVMKAVAFEVTGAQVGVASVRNRYDIRSDGAATQPLGQTWQDCAAAIRALGETVESLASRTVAVAVTGQGDGTWLVGADNEPVTDAWLWLDARAAPTVTQLSGGPLERPRFELTGTGLNTCQQGAQLAHMKLHEKGLLDSAETALHCKDWLYLNMTGVRATDPSEASFTFGNFRSRQYETVVLEALGLTDYRHLLPPIIEGTRDTHPLTDAAAAATGLHAGTPVCLGYVDMVMTALGAGVHTGDTGAACSTIGSTGVHMRAMRSDDVYLNDEGTGYVICLPVPGIVTQVQTNMAATLNIDWVLALGADLIGEFGERPSHQDMVDRIDEWMARSNSAGPLLYHPYISGAGERGPFVDANARSSFIGLSSAHRFADILRAVIEGLGMATRDCYAAMGDMPGELRLTGGAARSQALREVLAGALNTPVRVSNRSEAGAAGCAMMAAVAVGAYPDMDTCITDWVTPHLEAPTPPDAERVSVFNALYPAYRASWQSLSPVWKDLAVYRNSKGFSK